MITEDIISNLIYNVRNGYKGSSNNGTYSLEPLGKHYSTDEVKDRTKTILYNLKKSGSLTSKNEKKILSIDKEAVIKGLNLDNLVNGILAGVRHENFKNNFGETGKEANNYKNYKGIELNPDDLETLYNAADKTAFFVIRNTAIKINGTEIEIKAKSFIDILKKGITIYKKDGKVNGNYAADEIEDMYFKKYHGKQNYGPTDAIFDGHVNGRKISLKTTLAKTYFKKSSDDPKRNLANNNKTYDEAQYRYTIYKVDGAEVIIFNFLNVKSNIEAKTDNQSKESKTNNSLTKYIMKDKFLNELKQFLISKRVKSNSVMNYLNSISQDIKQIYSSSSISKKEILNSKKKIINYFKKIPYIKDKTKEEIVNFVNNKFGYNIMVKEKETKNEPYEGVSSFDSGTGSNSNSYISDKSKGQTDGDVYSVKTNYFNY